MSASRALIIHKLAALVLTLVVLVILATVLIAPPLYQHRVYRSSQASFRAQLDRFTAVANLRPALEKTLQDLNAQDLNKYYLKGNSLNLASADLQSHVIKLIESNNGRIVTSQTPQTPELAKPGEPQKVSMSVQFNATAPALQLILHAIESQEPYLFVDQLALRFSQGRSFKPTPGVQPECNVQLSVFGFMNLQQAAK